MVNSKSTKRALLTSALAILMCVAMLIGTTFAWFTDTASTGVNKITAGNLKMEVSYKNTADGTFATVDKNTPVLNNSALWEPGHVEYAVLNVKNVGTLALKYKLGINIASETGSTNVNGDAFKLSDYIKFAVIDGDQSALGRTALLEKATDSKLIKEGYSKESHLDTTGANETVTLVVWMPETVGNEANHAVDAAAPTIDLGINVFATQYTYEKDSFGDDYDANATYYPVIDAAGLKDALKVGGKVTLADDVAVVPDVDTSVENYKLFEQMTVTKDTTIDLSGKKIAFDVAEGTDFAKACPLLMAVTNGTLTINGDGEINCDAAGNNAYGININGGNVVINGGKYYGAVTAIQIQKGSLEINDGFFDMTDDCKATVPGYAKYIINCIDKSYKDGTATISVKGGTFVNFDPSDNPEGAGTTYVANGYDVISETQANGDVWYTVVKGTGAVVGTQDEMNTAISNNSDVTVKLTEAGTYSLPEMTDKEVSIIGTKDTVIDMTNKTNKAQSLSFKGVTVNFGTDDYYGFQHTGKLTYKDCTITGKQFLYAEEVVFDNCKFEQSAVDYNVWTYGAGHVLFNNCTFNCAGKSVLIYNEGSISGQTVEFQNCKFNASAPAAGKAAIEIDSSLLKNGATYKVIIDKATADSVTGFGVGTNSGSSVWNDKKGSSATVVVDGKTVLSAN